MTDEQEKLVLENIRLVGYCVYKYFPYIANQETREDAYQEGCLGLIHAAINFDITKGAAFSTYAASCILNQIRMYFRKNNYDGSECQSWADRDIVSSWNNRPDGETMQEFCDKHHIGYRRLSSALYRSRTIHLDDEAWDDAEGHSTTYGDIIADPLTINGLDVTETTLMLHIDKIVRAVAETYANNKQRSVWYEYMYARLFEIEEGMVEGSKVVLERTQQYLSIKYEYSQPQISRIVQRGLAEMRKIINNDYL